MKKLFKIAASLFVILGVFASLLCVNVAAAGTIIAFSSNTVTVGQDVTVSITVNPGEAMYGVKFIVNYDSNVLEYKSGNATGGAGTLQVAESPLGETKATYSLVFASKAAGTATISVADCVYAPRGGTGGAVEKVLTGALAKVTVKDVTLSGNANLKSLRPLAGTMTPAFSPDITEYTVAVKNSVTTCKISAVTADSGAKFDVEGSANLKIGENVRTVIVTAPNGTQKSYKLTIIRSADEQEPVVSTPEEPGKENPLEAEIAGNKFTVMDDLSSVTLFKGFTAVEGVYGETNVQVAADAGNNYRIYYLKAAGSETPVPYLYSEDTKTFRKVEYLVQGEYAYIFADIPSDYTVPENYYETNITVSGMNLMCYATTAAGFEDFYYVYCFADGEYGFYRYDVKENVIQRAPEISLKENVGSSNVTEEEDDGLFARFGVLSTNGKVIVICIVAIILIVIALAIILIIKLVRRKGEYDPYDDEYDDEPFDDVTVEDTTEQDTVVSSSEDDF